MISEYEKIYAGIYFDPTDPEIKARSLRTKSLIHKLNGTDPADVQARQVLLQQLFTNCAEGLSITTPFYCSRGYNIFAGRNFYANFDCVILDVTRVNIGNNVLMGPKVSIYTVTHPLDAQARREGLERAQEVTIGNDVWLCGNCVICPGVTIGENSVIAAGSVVTEDIPANVLAGGNPARVLKQI